MGSGIEAFVPVSEIDRRIPHLQVEIRHFVPVEEERSLAGFEELGSLRVVDRIAIRAIETLEGTQVILAWQDFGFGGLKQFQHGFLQSKLLGKRKRVKRRQWRLRNRNRHVEHIEEIAVDNVRNRFSSAVAGKLVLGENHRGTAGSTEIRAPIPDIDVRAAPLESCALANSRSGATVRASVREVEIKAGLRLDETVGDDSDAGNVVQGEHPANEMVDTVTDDHDANSAAITVPFEVPETGIDFDLFEEFVDFISSGTEQTDLRPHAFRRIDDAGFPARLYVPPRRKGETVENEIGNVVCRDGAVKIAER